MKVSDSLLEHMGSVLAEPLLGDPSLRAPDVGDVIGDRYRLVRLLGMGGMGRVFEAHDDELGRVALKLLSACDAAAQARFAREAALLADLTHPRIVRALDHGMHAGPSPFFVTELLEGITLSERIGRGPLSIADALRVAELVCEPLAALHERGVVHRDLQPGNVFLVSGEIERVTLLDFGLARALEDDDDLTFTGTTLGTPGYMAPEFLGGAPPDPKVDIFALGSLLLACLTGGSPENARHGASPESFPEELATLVAAMRSVDPAARPRDGAEASVRLDRVTRALGFRADDHSPEITESEPAPDWDLVQAALVQSTVGPEHAAAMTLANRWFDAAGIFSVAESAPGIDEGTLARAFERAGVPKRAAVWYRRAARASYQRSDFGDLFERVEAAARCGATEAQLGGLYLLQAQACGWDGRPREAIQHGGEAMRRLGQGSVAYLRAAAEVAVASARLGDGERVEAIAESFAGALDVRAPRWIIVSAARVVMALLAGGQMAAGRSLCQKLEAVADRATAGDAFGASRVALARSAYALFDGDLEGHADLVEKAAELAENAGDHRAALHDRTNWGFSLVELGRADDAHAVLERTRNAALEMGVSFTAALARKNLALVALQKGKWLDAEATATGAAIEAGENQRLISVSHAFAAFAALRAKELERAEISAHLAYEHAPGAMERARALGAKIEIALAKGISEQAQQHADEAERLLAEIPAIDGGEMLVWMAIAAARQARGDHGGSRDLLLQALGRMISRANAIRNPQTKGTFLAIRDHAVLVRRTFRIFSSMDS